MPRCPPFIYYRSMCIYNELFGRANLTKKHFCNRDNLGPLASWSSFIGLFNHIVSFNRDQNRSDGKN